LDLLISQSQIRIAQIIEATIAAAATPLSFSSVPEATTPVVFVPSEGFVTSSPGMMGSAGPVLTLGASVPLESVVEAMLGLLVVGGLVVPVPELVLLGLLLVRRLLVVLLVVLGAVVALLVVLATVVGLLAMGALVAVLEVIFLHVKPLP